MLALRLCSQLSISSVAARLSMLRFSSRDEIPDSWRSRLAWAVVNLSSHSSTQNPYRSLAWFASRRARPAPSPSMPDAWSGRPTTIVCIWFSCTTVSSRLQNLAAGRAGKNGRGVAMIPVLPAIATPTLASPGSSPSAGRSQSLRMQSPSHLSGCDSRKLAA